MVLFLHPIPETTNPPLYSYSRFVSSNQIVIKQEPWIWRTLYIPAKPRFGIRSLAEDPEKSWFYKTLRFTNMTVDVPFRIPPQCVSLKSNIQCVGMKPAGLQSGPRWTGMPPLSLCYELASNLFRVKFTVCLGVCPSSGVHWAHLHVRECFGFWRDKWEGYEACETHSCEQDHVSAWPGASLTVRPKDIRDSVTLSFTVCPINKTGRTLVMHVV